MEKLKDLKKQLIKAISSELEAEKSSVDLNRETLAKKLEILYQETNAKLADKQRQQLITDVLNDVIGYGPIQPLLDDPETAEIMITGPDNIYVERNGILSDTNIRFDDETHVMRIIDRILHPLGRQVDWDTPTADARLPDGSRVNVVIPPVSVDGPCITIRKFLKTKLSMDQIIALESITPHMAQFLKACIAARLNILITGNTSSGKTTMLNILTGYIPGNERIITIEDAAELQLKQKYVVRLETKAAGVDGSGSVTTRDLVRNALRMRPDRIVVGEVRGGEAIDMLQAMNTGHDGSLATLHANSPRDAISRLETMAMMSGLDLPLLAIRKQVASSIDLIVHMARLQDGTRKTTRITEASGMEGDIVTLSDIFKFEQSGVDASGKVEGELVPTGIRPLFSPRLEKAGFALGAEIFGMGYY